MLLNKHFNHLAEACDVDSCLPFYLNSFLNLTCSLLTHVNLYIGLLVKVLHGFVFQHCLHNFLSCDSSIFL